MPLVRGKYPLTHGLWKLTGGQALAAQANVGARSNLEWFGLANPTDGALAATGIACAVPIPVEIGDVFSKITVLVGATPESAGSHQIAALYSGIAVPALMAQSVDNTGAAAAGASAAFVSTLATPQLITPALAPNGFIYASIMFVATPPTALVVSTPAAVAYQWFANGPLFLSATHGSGLTTTAPATIASPAAKAVAPIVFLS